MGLGLHGGGLESARFLLARGAQLTITDLRDEKTLAPSIEQLEAACTEIPGCPSIRYVLGRHEIDDFKNADMVIKNPGVPPDSPYLKAARKIETDISLFLAESPARLTAVTGSKGKSSTASAIHWVLKMRNKELRSSNGNSSSLIPDSFLGGNIAVSPLVFLGELGENDDVVLELSSWQLGDLRGRRRADGSPGHPKDALLKPRAAVITAILPDHLDRYGSMEAYVDDKREIYRGQDSDDFTVAKDDSWGKSFLEESSGRPLLYSESPLPEGISGGWVEGEGPGFIRLYGAWQNIADGEIVELVPPNLLVPGYYQKQNLLAAGIALLGLGLPPETIRQGLGSFPGIEHRLEMFHKTGEVSYYNDSAATIPEAAAAAVEALNSNGSLILVCGGADKKLDFSPLVRAAAQVKVVVLLAGSGSEKLGTLLSGAGIAYHGPFDSLEKAVAATLARTAPGDRVVLSPGCASFGMFLNEFDRGHQWKETVKRLT